MMRTVISLLIALAAWLHGTWWTYSCGPYPDLDRVQISYLEPNLLSDSLFQEYYRLFLHERQWPEFQRGFGAYNKLRDRNIDEWNRYFGGNIPDSQIVAVVYRLRHDDFLPLYEQAVARQPVTLPDSLASNLVMKGLAAGEHLRAFKYLLFAKRVEPHVDDSYLWNGSGRDSAAMARLIGDGVREYEETTSEELRFRYAYQLVRLARYSGSYKRALDLYTRLVVPNRSESTLRWRALSHAAAAMWNLGRKDEALYHFSIAFDKSEQKEENLFGFNGMSEAQWKRVLAFAKNDHERATLWMMRGLSSYRLDLEPLRKMIELEPSSPRTSFMLLREVHRAETFIYSDRLTRHAKLPNRVGMLPTNGYDIWQWHPPERKGRVPSARYGEQFQQLVLTTASQGSVDEPGLWYMVAGYLELLEGRPARSLPLLDSAASAGRNSGELVRQVRLLRYLATAKSTRIDRALEASFAADLAWLRQKDSANNHMKFDRTMAALGQQYLLQNDVPRAALAFFQAHDHVSTIALLDIYATHDDLRALDELITRGGSTDFERTLLDSFPLRHEEMLDLRATRLARQERFTEALRLFDSLPAWYWQPADSAMAERTWSREAFARFATSFTETRQSGMTSYEAQQEGETFTKPEFIRRIVSMEERAKREPAITDSLYMAIANGFFNTPFWGYSAVVWNGGWTTYARYYYNAVEYPFNIPTIASRMDRADAQFYREYGSRDVARRYYEKALAATKDRELAARAVYMIDLTRNRPLTSLHPTPQRQSRDAYNTLRTKYADTRFAQEVLRSCATYEAFRR